MQGDGATRDDGGRDDNSRIFPPVLYISKTTQMLGVLDFHALQQSNPIE